MNVIFFLKSLLKEYFPWFFKILLYIHSLYYFFVITVINYIIVKIFIVNSKPKELLLIRSDEIGDFIIWLNTAKEFRELYKDFKITLLCKLDYAEIANELQYFDSVIPFDKKKFKSKYNFSYRFSMLKNIRKNGYHTVISVKHVRDFICDDSIIRVSGAVERIGFYGDLLANNNWQTKISNRYYTNLIKLPNNQKTILEFNTEFIQALGLKQLKCSLPKLPDELFSKKYFNIEKKYYVLFPGAGQDYRKWPAEKFAIIAQKIYRKTGWIGIICGGLTETLLGEKVLQNTKDILMINMIGKTSMLELAKIIRDAEIVIANETSAVHIATAVSTPSVCILGGGHYGLFLPIPIHLVGVKPYCVTYEMDCFNCTWNCVYKIKSGDSVPCIKNISVDDVWGKVDLIINS